MILEYLSIQDVLSFRTSVKQFSNVCHDEFIWKKAFRREFGNIFHQTNDWKESCIKHFNAEKRVEKLYMIENLFDGKHIFQQFLVEIVKNNDDPSVGVLFGKYKIKVIIDNNIDDALIEASKIGNYAIVRLLVDARIFSESNLWLSLKEASRHGWVKIVEFFLTFKKFFLKESLKECFASACSGGHHEVAELLLNTGVRPDSKFDSLMKEAMTQGYAQIVKVLMDAGVKPMIMKQFTLRSNENIEECFLLQKKKKNSQSKEDINYFIKEVCTKKHIELINLLFREKLVHPNVINNNTVVYLFSLGNVDLARFLCKNCKITRTTQNKIFNTLLEQNQSAVLGEVLKTFSIKNKCLEDAFSYSCKHGYFEILKLILERINPPKKKFPKAIESATKKGYTKIIDLLLPNDQIDDYEIKSYVVDVAFQFGHKSIIRLILKKYISSFNIFSTIIYEIIQSGDLVTLYYLLQDPDIREQYELVYRLVNKNYNSDPMKNILRNMFSFFPDEILFMIMKNVPMCDFPSVMSLNKKYKKRLDSNHFWGVMFKERFKIIKQNQKNWKDVFIRYVKIQRKIEAKKIDSIDSIESTIFEDEKADMIKILVHHHGCVPTEKQVKFMLEYATLVTDELFMYLAKHFEFPSIINDRIFKIAFIKNQKKLAEFLFDRPEINPLALCYVDVINTNEFENSDLVIKFCSKSDILRESSFVFDLTLTAIKKHKNCFVQNILNDNNFDPSMNDNELFITACDNSNGGIIRRLLCDRRVDPAARKNEAFIRAVMNEDFAVMMQLINDGRVDPSTQNNKAIHYAIVHCKTNVERCLRYLPSVYNKLDSVYLSQFQ